MNDTLTSPAEVIDLPTDEAPTSAVFVAYHFSGQDNGVPKEGFDSRVIHAPADVQITSTEDVKALADAIATSEFQNGRKFIGLQITLINIFRLPV